MTPQPDPENPHSEAEFVARHLVLTEFKIELLVPVEAAIGYIHMLRDDTAQRDTSNRLDIEKLLTATAELYEHIRSHLSSEWPELRGAGFEDRLRQTRHDIGNRLNHALGYVQLMLLDEHDLFGGEMAGDIEQIQQLCRQCESTLSRHKQRHDSPEFSTSLLDHSASTMSGPSGIVTGATPTPVLPARILVTDDSPLTCDMLRRFLERMGHIVVQAESGPAALEILRRGDVDLLLLDFLMPGMTGFQVLQAINSDQSLRRTPVIMISALDASADIAPCIELGADDYLTKPVDFTLLKARVNASLERARLREREYGQFFTPELARHFVRNPSLVQQGREAEVTILFCDVRGFSRISERLGPSETVEWLSNVMDELSECVRNHQGVLVDYIGDELMAMWGAPAEQPNHAELACRAAFEISEMLPKLNERWQQLIGEPMDVGIGLNSGIARVGNTGSKYKFKYGPLGNTVNLASRVQGATKYLGLRLLATHGTVKLLQSAFPTRRLCQVEVVNIREPVELYEIFSPAHPVPHELIVQYEAALSHFERREMRPAAAILGRVLVDHSHDGPSLLLTSRVLEQLLHATEDFDPVWRLPGK